MSQPPSMLRAVIPALLAAVVLAAGGCARTPAGDRSPAPALACDTTLTDLAVMHLRSAIPASGERNLYDIGWVDGDSVRGISDPTVCARAAAAYVAHFRPGERPPREQWRVGVARGGGHYLVRFSPPIRGGEWAFAIVFDSLWQMRVGLGH